MSIDRLRQASLTGPKLVEYSTPKVAATVDAWEYAGRPYKALLPASLVISMAMVYLPKDGTEWLSRLQAAHKRLSESWLGGDAADVPAQVAMTAFESMGYQYMEVENGVRRYRLGIIAYRHLMLFREHCDAVAQ